LIGRLGSRSSPTAVGSSASDLNDFFREGGLHFQIWKEWARVNSEILSGIGQNGNMQEIIVGPVEENGKDLPSGKNLGDYMNEKGRMDVLKFFEDP